MNWNYQEKSLHRTFPRGLTSSEHGNLEVIGLLLWHLGIKQDYSTEQLEVHNLVRPNHTSQAAPLLCTPWKGNGTGDSVVAISEN